MVQYWNAVFLGAHISDDFMNLHVSTFNLFEDTIHNLFSIPFCGQIFPKNL